MSGPLNSRAERREANVEGGELALLSLLITHLLGTVIVQTALSDGHGPLPSTKAEQYLAPALQGHAGPRCSSGQPLSVGTNLPRHSDCALQHLPWGGSGWELVTPGRISCRQLSSWGDVHLVVRG